MKRQAYKLLTLTVEQLLFEKPVRSRVYKFKCKRISKFMQMLGKIQKKNRLTSQTKLLSIIKYYNSNNQLINKMCVCTWNLYVWGYVIIFRSNYWNICCTPLTHGLDIIKLKQFQTFSLIKKLLPDVSFRVCGANNQTKRSFWCDNHFLFSFVFFQHNFEPLSRIGDNTKKKLFPRLLISKIFTFISVVWAFLFN